MSSDREDLAAELRRVLAGDVDPDRIRKLLGIETALFAEPPDVVVIDNLPFPPSVNHYMQYIVIPKVKGKNFGTNRDFRVSSFPSDDTKVFREEATLRVRMARAKKLKGDLRCEVVFYEPDKRMRDIDNLPKCLLDGLKAAELYGDDSQIRELKMKFGPPVKGGKTAVRLTTLGA